MLKLCCRNKTVLYYKHGEYCIYRWVYTDIKNNICVDEKNFGNYRLLHFYHYIRNKIHFMDSLYKYLLNTNILFLRW